MVPLLFILWWLQVHGLSIMAEQRLKGAVCWRDGELG